MMLQDTKIDMLSLSGHIIEHAPKASVFCTCVVVLAIGHCCAAVIRSAAEGQEPKTALLLSAWKSLRTALQFIEYENTKVKAMRDRLERCITEQIPHCFVTGDLYNRLPTHRHSL